MNLKEKLIVMVRDEINNNRWETVYYVNHSDPDVNGSLFFSADTPKGVSEPVFKDDQEFVEGDLNSVTYAINSTVEEWLTAKKNYYKQLEELK